AGQQRAAVRPEAAAVAEGDWDGRPRPAAGEAPAASGRTRNRDERPDTGPRRAVGEAKGTESRREAALHVPRATLRGLTPLRSPAQRSGVNARVLRGADVAGVRLGGAPIISLAARGEQSAEATALRVNPCGRSGARLGLAPRSVVQALATSPTASSGRSPRL